MRGCGRRLGPRKKAMLAWMCRPKKSFHLKFDDVGDMPQIFKFKGDAMSVKNYWETVVRIEVKELKRGGR